MIRRTACPVCDAAGERCTPESPNYDVCTSCAVVYRKAFNHIRPDEGWDEIYYSDDRVMQYYLKRYSAFRRIVRMMNDVVGARGKWLDVGCGVGVLLQVAYEQGWEVYGIDPSRLCVEAAVRRLKYAHLVRGAIDEKLREFTGFAVVSVHEVLRILENPGKVLVGLRDALVEGGWLFIREVKADWQRGSRSAEVAGAEGTWNVPLQLWNPGALENALRLAGFRNVYSVPSAAFTETSRDERDSRKGLRTTVERIAKRAAWPVARIVHGLSGGRVYLGPNFITLGQK